MKRIGIFMLVLFMAACRPEPFSPKKINYLEEAGIADFRIEGVPAENIIVVEKGIIQVRLPENYKGGNVIRPSARLLYGGKLEPDITQGIEYEGKNLTFSYNTGEGTSQFQLQVAPFQDLVTLGNNQAYRYTVQGESVETIQVQVQHYGTSDFTGELESSIKLKNTTDNKEFSTSIIQMSKAANGNTVLHIAIPAYLTAGTYTVSVNRRGKEIPLKDPLVVTYGNPIFVNNPLAKRVNTEKRELILTGYNLTTDHRYEAELTNDFSSPVRFSLTPASQLSIKGNIPANVSAGTYAFTLYLDGKAVTFPGNSLNSTENIVLIKSQPEQPELLSVSDASALTTGYFQVYAPQTVLSKSQRIVAFVINTEGASPGLRLTNTQTQQVYELKEGTLLRSPAAMGVPYFSFAWPANIPAGTYTIETFYSSATLGRIVTSEKYHRVITIQ